MRRTLVDLVGNAHFGQDPPAAPNPTTLRQSVERTAGAALRPRVSKPRHRPADDVAADQLNALLRAQQQVINGLERHGFHLGSLASSRKDSQRKLDHSKAAVNTSPTQAAILEFLLRYYVQGTQRVGVDHRFGHGWSTGGDGPHSGPYGDGAPGSLAVVATLIKAQRIEENDVRELLQQSTKTGDPIMQTFIDRYIEQGVQQGRADMLLRQIERRFGPLSDQVRERVTQADPKTLLEWSDRILDANSLDEVLYCCVSPHWLQPPSVAMQSERPRGDPDVAAFALLNTRDDDEFLAPAELASQADLEAMQQCLECIREKLPLDDCRIEDGPTCDAIKQNLTGFVSIAIRTGSAVAVSLRGPLAANHENCFAILATEGLIDVEMADALTTAVSSWALLATAPDAIGPEATHNFCRYFLTDFEKYVRAMQ